MSRHAVTSLVLLSIAACSPGDPAASAPAGPAAVPAAAPQVRDSGRREVAVFAGGCFWSTEANFEQMPGVVAAVSGFAGGRVANPRYEQVVRGGTGHLESVQVTFDPARITYLQLVDLFWLTIYPTDPEGQFWDQWSP